MQLEIILYTNTTRDHIVHKRCMRSYRTWALVWGSEKRNDAVQCICVWVKSKRNKVQTPAVCLCTSVWLYIWTIDVTFQSDFTPYADTLYCLFPFLFLIPTLKPMYDTDLIWNLCTIWILWGAYVRYHFKALSCTISIYKPPLLQYLVLGDDPYWLSQQCHSVMLGPGVHLDARFCWVASVLGFLLLPPATQICGKRVFGVT